MRFNSIEFLIFFCAVTTMFFLLPHRWRWVLLLAASCCFYMAFIPVYIVILFVLIAIDYTAGILIERNLNPGYRRVILIFSILSTCAALFTFKYFNFFAENLTHIARILHWNYSLNLLRLALPIGLSFHTFQSLSYVIEVYKGNYRAERHLGIYALYVLFYPQLVAGPIERPHRLLPQFRIKHDYDEKEIVQGLQLMLVGLFQKVVIADRLALFVNPVFNSPQNYQSPALFLATIFFAFQIYCDFCGYSNIAVGSARAIGFRLSTNFNHPYFALSISDFWRRWHISLSSWFRDYVYFGLGGNRVSIPRWLLNIIITFVLSGIWHGANWTFLAWGLLNALYLAAGRLTEEMRLRVRSIMGLNNSSRPNKAFKILVTFGLVCFGWIFFRANSLKDAFYITAHLFGMGRLLASCRTLPGLKDLLMNNVLFSLNIFDYGIVGISLAAMALFHLVPQLKRFSANLVERPRWVRWICIYSLLLWVSFCGNFSTATHFIYFQF